mmetsp:Transcript_126/g.442  ORF Transcript_126/g.442 Transcript_126/m.442 type:complete len:317 (-) Transcript_126:1043-1993(-)
MTSRMLGESVSSITSRSTPSPMPAVGGMPYSSAVTKSSSSSIGYASCSKAASACLPCASATDRASACAFLCVAICASSRARWSVGSVSSLNEFANSRPTTNSSKRSVTSFSARCGFASGEISTGWFNTNVGWRKVLSTVDSKSSFRTWPTLGAAATPAMPAIDSLSPSARNAASAAALHASRSPSFSPPLPSPNVFRISTPHRSDTRSFIEALRHGLAPRSTVSSPYGIFKSSPSKPRTPFAHRTIISSVNSNMSSTSAYAWYTSTEVNSGLCRVDKPSLRNTLPSSYTRSKPPTTSRFKCSSVAMRMVRSIPSAL